MTRAQYEAKYGSAPAISSAPTEPIKMTRAQYEAKYGFDVPAIEVPKEKKLAYAKADAEKAQIESKKANSFTGILGNTLKNVGSTLASSEIGLGKTVAKSTEAKNLETYNGNITNLTNTNINLMKKIRETDTAGGDSTKLKRIYNDNLKLIGENKKSIDDFNESIPTNKQAAGQLGGVALDMLTAGTFKGAKAGVKSFNLAKKEVPTVIDVIKNAGKEETKKEAFKSAAKTTVKTAPTGYAYDVSQNAQENKDKIFTPGLGTAFSLIPGATEASRALAIKTPKKAESYLGKILPSLTEDKFPSAKASVGALKDKTIKSETDLVKAIQEDQKRLNESTDTALLKDSAKIKMSDDKTGVIKTALQDLKDHAESARKPELLAKIEAWVTKAKGEGLTRKELNDITRESSINLSQKSFTKSGVQKDAERGQAIENTRKALKKIVRAGEGGAEAEANDLLYSQHADTLLYAKKQADAYQKALNALKERGTLSKVGNVLGHALDFATGGLFRGVINAAKTGGLEKMTAIDIHNAYKKNIKIFSKIMKTQVPERVQALVKKLDKRVLMLPAPKEGAPQSSNFKPIELGARSQSTIDKAEMANPAIKTPKTTQKTLRGRARYAEQIRNANKVEKPMEDIQMGDKPKPKKSDLPTATSSPAVFSPELPKRYTGKSSTSKTFRATIVPKGSSKTQLKVNRYIKK